MDQVDIIVSVRIAHWVDGEGRAKCVGRKNH